MSNNIIISSYKPEILKRFIRSYNLSQTSTSQVLSLLIDDRRTAVEVFYEALNGTNLFDNIIKISDVVKFGKELYSDSLYYDDIMTAYPIAFKQLIFSYMYSKYSMKKSMILDDDTLFIKPVDKYFDCEYALRSDSMKADEGMLKVLQAAFPHIECKKVNQNLINSGSLIFTYEKELDNHMGMFFDSVEVKNYLIDAHIKSLKFGKPRISGMASITEQLVYGCYLLGVDEDKKSSFNSAVRLITSTPETTEPITFNKHPNIYHFLMRDKITYMDWYLNTLEKDFT